MLRRTLAALTVALSAAVVALPAAGPATAADACIFTPPTRIVIYQQLVIGQADIRGACRPAGHGEWITAGRGSQASAYFDALTGPDTYLYVSDDLNHYGVNRWIGMGAARVAGCQGENCFDLPQNSPSSDIRLGGYASITGTRSGSKVTFTVGSGGWSPFSHKLVARPNLGGEVQTLFADGTWHRVGVPFRTGSNAKATVTYTIAATRSFRFAIYSTANYFERASNPITR